jgi:hypothetical protein
MRRWFSKYLAALAIVAEIKKLVSKIRSETILAATHGKKKVGNFSVPIQDVTNQTFLAANMYFNYSGKGEFGS